MKNRKYTKNFQRKKKTVKEEHRFSMVLDFSSATLKLENSETMSSRRQGNDVQSRITYPDKLNCVQVEWSYFSCAGFQKLYLPLYFIRKLLDDLQIESVC